MSLQVRRILLFGLPAVAVALVLLLAWNPLRASPGRQEGIDLERYQALRAQVEDLHRQGYDVSHLEVTIRDIETWIAAGKVAEANLRITDLEGDLTRFDPMARPLYPPEPALPPAPVYPPAPEATAEVLLATDFSGADPLTAWSSRFLTPDPGNTAAWEKRQEALYLNMHGGSMAIVGMVSVVGEKWEDYVYSVDIYPAGNLEVGAVFRYTDDGFYRFRFLSGEYTTVPTRLLERVKGEEVAILAQAEGPGYQSEQWYNVQVAVVGAQITVYLNGEPILRATDGEFRQGQVGVYALSLGSVYFDNIRVFSAR